MEYRPKEISTNMVSWYTGGIRYSTPTVWNVAAETNDRNDFGARLKCKILQLGMLGIWDHSIRNYSSPYGRITAQGPQKKPKKAVNLQTAAVQAQENQQEIMLDRESKLSLHKGEDHVLHIFL